MQKAVLPFEETEKQRNNPTVVVVVKAKKTQQQNKQHPEIFSHSNHIYAIFYVK